MEKLPKGALRLVERNDECCALAVADGDESKKIKMRAYSGGIIKNHWYWDDLAIDLTGMSFPGTKFPILEDHRTDKKIAFTGKPIVNGNKLDINPDTTKFVDTPESVEFQKLSSEGGGFPYQASIYARPSSVERVMEGEKAKVNGMSVKGPISIWRKCTFMEASVCVFGWDSETQASAFSRKETEEIDVEYTGSIDSQTLNDGIEEVTRMDLNELKKDHADLVTKLTDEVTVNVTTTLTEKFDGEKATLQAKIDEGTQKLEDKEERLLKLEKSDIIRQEKDLKSHAVNIWDSKLSESEVSEHLYDKVKAMVSHVKFTKDGILDEDKFGEAIDAEIKDWEDRGATTQVLGSGFSEKTIDSEVKKIEKMAKEDDETVKDLAALAGREIK